MSDGMTDGYRSARAAEARQKTIDAFFGMVLARATGVKPDQKDFREAFDAFDAHRYADPLLHGRARKERGKRWEEFNDLLISADGKRSDLHVSRAWAEILALAMRFASSRVTEALHQASVYRTCHIALYVPNGTGFYGPTPPSLFGDFAAALDAIAAEPFRRPGMYAQIIEDPYRAVTGIRTGGGTSEEVREEERASLRFLAVEKG